MAVIWFIITCRRRHRKRSQFSGISKSRGAYAKLQKPRPVSTDKSSKRTSTSTTSISSYTKQVIDLEAQAQTSEEASIYNKKDAAGVAALNRVVSKASIKRPQTSARTSSALDRNPSVSSHYSYDRHISEYTGLVSPELQALISEEQETLPEVYQDFPEVAPGQSQPLSIPLPSTPNQYRHPRQPPHSPHLPKNTTTAASESAPTPSPNPQSHTTTLPPPLPRKSSRRSSAPTSIDQRLRGAMAAPALLVTKPSVSTLAGGEVFELEGSDVQQRQQQRYELEDQQGRRGGDTELLLSVPRRTSTRRSRSSER
ncbi:hypothetical protein H2198_000209 [Neophaeococcomyces mojaviensis]|uniref:Uncharacterized protein n=1 Tax=Neophaeococcomyces mojaviensis TaxID=3383035 RepID=A0ACC3AKN5_9EURO|nr:hypothetical protein H2198_000209 [Knufia sp. JES_112]